MSANLITVVQDFKHVLRVKNMALKLADMENVTDESIEFNF